MASTPRTSFGSGSSANDTTRRTILPPTPSTAPSTDHSDSDNASDRDRGRDCGRARHHDRHHDPDDDDDDNDDDDERNDGRNDETARAFDIIWDSFRGLPVREAYPTCFLQDQQGYEKLCEKLSARDGLLSYLDKSVRKDWNANTSILTLRLMPSPLHEYFQDYLIDAIKKELDRIVLQYPSLQPFRDSIESGAHSDYRSSTGFTKSPDGQFSYDGIRHPQFVLEVAYSEEEKHAMNKSHEYFTERPGEISAVLLVDIFYALKRERRAEGYSRSASVSLWTSRKEEDIVTVQRTVDAAVFRKDGQASVGELVLPFELFVPPDRRHTLPVQDAALRLSYALLSNFVTRAEKRQRLAPPPPSPRNKIKFIDEFGDDITDDSFDAKRRKGSHQSDRSGRKTRSMNSPRTSIRLRSSSNNKVT